MEKQNQRPPQTQRSHHWMDDNASRSVLVEKDVRVKVECTKTQPVKNDLENQDGEKRPKRKPRLTQEWGIYTLDRQIFQWKILPSLGSHPSKEAAQECAEKHFFGGKRPGSKWIRVKKIG